MWIECTRGREPELINLARVENISRSTIDKGKTCFWFSEGACTTVNESYEEVKKLIMSAEKEYRYRHIDIPHTISVNVNG